MKSFQKLESDGKVREERGRTEPFGEKRLEGD